MVGDVFSFLTEVTGLALGSGVFVVVVVLFCFSNLNPLQNQLFHILLPLQGSKSGIKRFLRKKTETGQEIFSLCL